VVAVPDPHWGARIVAVTDGQGSIEDLQQFLSQTLPRHSMPRQLVHLDRLPRTGSGKIDRLELRAELRRRALAGSLR
jgi:acyl-CoA synthetase (AMP-forming)/AMP-acid ligase II